MTMVSKSYHTHITKELCKQISDLEKQVAGTKALEFAKRKSFQEVIDIQGEHIRKLQLQLAESESAIAELKGKLWTPFTQVISADRQGNPKTFRVEAI